MSRDEFTKLFKYIQDLRADVGNRFDKLDLDIQEVISMLNKMSKRQEISNDERLVIGHQLDHLNRWTHELADKIGHKLAA